VSTGGRASSNTVHLIRPRRGFSHTCTCAPSRSRPPRPASEPARAPVSKQGAAGVSWESRREQIPCVRGPSTRSCVGSLLLGNPGVAFSIEAAPGSPCVGGPRTTGEQAPPTRPLRWRRGRHTPTCVATVSGTGTLLGQVSGDAATRRADADEAFSALVYRSPPVVLHQGGWWASCRVQALGHFSTDAG
jgi:hypothetical protein